MPQICIDSSFDEQNMFGLNFYRMLLKGILVDATIVCATHTVRVHKIMLAANSRYLDNVIKSHHPAEPVIIIKGMEVDILRALVEYMYIGKTKIDAAKFSSLSAAADRFEITSFKNASTNYEDFVSSADIGNIASFAENADADINIFENDPNLPRIVDTVTYPVDSPAITPVVYLTCSEENDVSMSEIGPLSSPLPKDEEIFELIPIEEIEYYNSLVEQDNTEDGKRSPFTIVDCDFSNNKDDD